MAFKLGVLLIHGMGSQDPAYANGMIEELDRLIRKAGADDTAVAYEPVWWSHVLAKRQETLLRQLSDGTGLDWGDLRHFVVHALGDAVAYQDVSRGAGKLNVYQEVHAEIGKSMKELRERLRMGTAKGDPDPPLVVIAHSLGCHMISNFIWDRTHAPKSKRAPTAFERFETLALIVTFGCNIPLFTLSYQSLEPITFPPPTLARAFPSSVPAERIAQVARWLNLYDPDDVLGWPLRPINARYDATVTEDRAVNVGGPLRSWSPQSHTEYWTDNDVTRPTAEAIVEILRLL